MEKPFSLALHLFDQNENVMLLPLNAMLNYIQQSSLPPSLYFLPYSLIPQRDMRGQRELRVFLLWLPLFVSHSLSPSLFYSLTVSLSYNVTFLMKVCLCHCRRDEVRFDSTSFFVVKSAVMFSKIMSRREVFYIIHILFFFFFFSQGSHKFHCCSFHIPSPGIPRYQSWELKDE